MHYLWSGRVRDLVIDIFATVTVCRVDVSLISDVHPYPVETAREWTMPCFHIHLISVCLPGKSQTSGLNSNLFC